MIQESNQARLNYILGKNSVLFSTPQRALETCLEALGVSLYETPVVLPVTAPTWVLSAVLRSGGVPVLLDIVNLFEYNSKILQEVVEDQEELVILHLENLIANPIENAIKDKVNIYISSNFYCLRSEDLTKDFHFIVCETENIVLPHAGILHSQFSDSLTTIRNIKNGVLGIGDYYPEELASKFIGNYEFYYKRYYSEFVKLFNQFYDNVMIQKGLKCYHTSSLEWLPIGVSDAKKTLVLLQDFGIECRIDFQPLYAFPEIGQRFKEPPEVNYPEAQKLYNKILSIKITESNLNKLKEITI